MFRRIQNITHLNNSIKFKFYKPPDFDISKDYYKVLNVKQSDSSETIKQAYYALAKKHHPDLNKGNGEYFKIIKEAYEVLSDSTNKQQYDLSRSYGGGQGYQDTQSQDPFKKSSGPFAGQNPFNQKSQGTSNDQADNESYTDTSTQNDTNKQNPQSITEELLNFLNALENFLNKSKMQNNQQMYSNFNKLEQFMKLVYMGVKIVNGVWNLWIKWNDKRKK